MTDRGSVSVLLVGLIGVIVLFASALASVGAYLRARVEAGTAADAAALAAAPVTFLPFGAEGSPADEARRFAAANGARLVGCVCGVDASWEARTVRVEVEKVATLWPVGSVTVRAVGRAEFVPMKLVGGE